MKKLLLLTAVLGASAASHAIVWDLTAGMSAAQHGHVGVLGTAMFTGSYDDVTNEITVFSMEAMDLTSDVTMSHIHLGGIGVNGPVLINFADLGTWSTGPNPVFTPNGVKGILNEADEAAFLSNGTYINIHTGQFPGGEVRGQVQSQAVPEPATIALLGLGAAAFVRRKRKS